MNTNSKIYIAGHTGLVGSAILRKYQSEGYTNLLFRTHAELDLINQQETELLFEKEKPEYVIVTANKVGGIKANMTYPAEFLYDNLMIQNNVMWSAYRHKVKKLLYVACGCAYPTQAPQPVTEDCLLTGVPEPTNEGFAIAKIAGIKLCEKLKAEYGVNFISCIPANAYGPNDHYDPIRSHVLPALIKRFHDAKIQKLSSVEMWGTGVALREFIYADDLADAIYLLMEQYEENKCINVGTGENITMKELSQLIKETVGYTGEITYDTTKPDGMLKRSVDASRIKKMGFKAHTSLKEGLKKTYEDFLKNQ